MTLQEALHILNLNINYTEEELRKSYRSLIIKYHPDKHPENKKTYAENKTKQINEAKEILEKALKNNNTQNTYNNNKSNNTYNNSNYHTQTNQQNNTQEFLDLLKKAKNFVVEEYNTINSIDSNDLIFMKHKSNLTNILDIFLSKLTIINDIAILKKEYQIFKIKYKQALINYYNNFTNFVYTDEDNILWTIHYCDTLKEVRNVIIISIDNELQEEISKYSNHKYYQNILPLLNKIKNVLTLTCLYGSYKLEIIKKTFNKIISKEFKEYEERKEIIENLNVTIPGYVEMRYQQFKYDIHVHNFHKLYTRIETVNKVKSKIRKIFKKH